MKIYIIEVCNKCKHRI